MDQKASNDTANALTFKMGETVRAKLTSDGVLRIGQIVAVHRTGLYDVTFDDGGRPKEGLDLASELISKEPEAEEGVFLRGTAVEALRAGTGQWVRGTVAKITLTASGALYEVKYTDNSTETLPAANVRPAQNIIPPHSEPASEPATAISWAVGQAVEARYHGGRLWYPGTIRALGDGCVDVLYDDGDAEDKVPLDYIRILAPAAAAAAAAADGPETQTPRTPDTQTSAPNPQISSQEALAGAAFTVDQRIEGNFQSSGHWFPGTVKQIRVTNGSYFYCVEYNDGDVEDNVPERLLRPLGGKLKATAVPVPGKPTSGTMRPTPQKHRRLSAPEEAGSTPEEVQAALTVGCVVDVRHPAGSADYAPARLLAIGFSTEEVCEVYTVRLLGGVQAVRTGVKLSDLRTSSEVAVSSTEEVSALAAKVEEVVRVNEQLASKLMLLAGELMTIKREQMQQAQQMARLAGGGQEQP